MKNNKKKLIFTCGKMKIGGVQKSLISLLNNLDYDKIEVTILLDNLNGELMNMLPSDVKVIELEDKPLEIHKLKVKSFYLFKELLKNPTLPLFIFKNIFNNERKFNSKAITQFLWNKNKNKINKLNNTYDIAISYAGGMGIWNEYVIDKIDSKKKILWIHGNYNNFGSKSDLEKEYYQKFDNIYVVTEKLRDFLIDNIENIEHKIEVAENIIDHTYISNLSFLEVENESKLFDDSSNTYFLSLMRVEKSKGIDLGIDAFKIALKENNNLTWYILGAGSSVEYFKSKVRNLGLEDNIVFLGPKLNPYIYLRLANVYFHPSYGEGKSISVEEAKNFNKPILITNYPTVRDQINDDITGIITELDAKTIATNLVRLHEDVKLRNKLISNLKGYRSKSNVLEMIYHLLNNN